MEIFLDFAQPERPIGKPCIDGPNGQAFCPECLEPVFGPEYGMAFGGLGSYWICGAECGWFHKILDEQET